ncbi:MAG: hypothetical protein V7782_09135 [Psychromonas sp.]
MSADFGEINILLATSHNDCGTLCASKNMIFPCAKLSALSQANYDYDIVWFIGVTGC